ncbi:MAG: tetratricopeptide repeat protein [Bradymonadales bacterium]|nr:tetratricopeptide repeat protein [Bradymonadales bacterium]
MMAMQTYRTRFRQAFARFLCLLVALILAAATGEVVAQTGRYEGTTQAQQAFARGQAQAAEGDRLLREGEQDRAQRAYAQAEREYREAIRHNADYLEAIERLAYVMYVSGRSREAVDLLEEALDRHPGDLSLRRMMGINLYELGQIPQAITILEEIDQLGGATTDVTFILGKYYYEQESYPTAISYFQRYLVDQPADAATHGALGNAYLRTEQYELALAEFRTVIDLAPDNLTARINIGDVYFASADHERAINVYSYVVERDPENVRLWFNMGKSYFELGRFSEALDSFQRVTRLRPDLHQGHYYAGATLVELRRYEEGRQALSRAIALEPDHALSLYRLGQAEAHLGRLPEAEEALNRAVALNPEEPWFVWALGDVQRRRGRYQQAVELHQNAIRMDGDESPFHESLGRDLVALGRIDEATASLEQAIELDPDRVSSQQALAVSLLHRVQLSVDQQRYDTAQTDLDRVAGLGTHPTEVALNQAILALLQDQLDAAALALDSVTGPQRDTLSFRRVQAQLALQQGQPANIAEILADLASSDPAELDTRDAALLGHGAAQEQNWERAIALFNRAASSDDRFLAAVSLCRLRRGLQLADRNRWGDAADQFRQALDHSDHLESQDVVRLQLSLGISELANQNWGRAQRALSEARRGWDALRSDSRSRLPSRDTLRTLDLWLAYAHYRDRNYREAIDQLRALPTGGDARLVAELLVSAHDHLARTELERNNIAAARAHFETVLEQVPDNPITRNNYACLLYSSGDRQEAGRILEQLAEAGTPVNALFNYAIYLDEVADQPESAYRHYLRYVQQDGEAADEARRFARIKEEVFGFESR